MKPSCIMEILTSIPCLPPRWSRPIEWLCLVIEVIGRRRGVDSHSRWWFYVDYVIDGFLVGSMRDRVGQPAESGEYLMGRSKGGLFSYSELRRWKPMPVSIKKHVGWALLRQALIMY
jgi:hypothetical protein